MKPSVNSLPDFIAVGPPRTGTTWLYQVLKPHVLLPKGVKETSFFAWNFELGLEWYEAHFSKRRPGQLAGEICPVYFDRPEARERIAELIPDCKIICTLRDPVERLHSHYRLLRRTGYFGDVTFAEALALHRRWSGPGNMFISGGYTYHLKGWLDKFGRERVLVMLYDDLVSDPQAYLDRISAFVGITPIKLSESQMQKVNAIERPPRNPKYARMAEAAKTFLRRHRLYWFSERFKKFWDFWQSGGEEFEPLDAALESRLREDFRADVEQLERLLGRDLSNWKCTTAKS